ncbi:MAG: hypothetical protein ABMB14_28910 [Myxococcota bacterium]
MLVTGFGPFPGVPYNPTTSLAIAIDGLELDGLRFVGRVIPVTWQSGPDAAIAHAGAVGADAVVGTGVAPRPVLCVERVAVRVEVGRPDAAGATGPDRDARDRDALPLAVYATLDPVRLADALGATLSDDAGRYVCNQWLYRVAAALPVPVGFVHVTPRGLPSEQLAAAIARTLRPAQRADTA